MPPRTPDILKDGGGLEVEGGDGDVLVVGVVVLIRQRVGEDLRRERKGGERELFGTCPFLLLSWQPWGPDPLTSLSSLET